MICIVHVNMLAACKLSSSFCKYDSVCKYANQPDQAKVSREGIVVCAHKSKSLCGHDIDPCTSIRFLVPLVLVCHLLDISSLK